MTSFAIIPIEVSRGCAGHGATHDPYPDDGSCATGVHRRSLMNDSFI